MRYDDFCSGYMVELSKGSVEIVRTTEKAYIAVSYCCEPWEEQFRLNAERCAESRALHKAPSSRVLEEHPGLISSLSRTCDVSGYMKIVALLCRTCTERYAWIDALCIPQCNGGGCWHQNQGSWAFIIRIATSALFFRERINTLLQMLTPGGCLNVSEERGRTKSTCLAADAPMQ